MSAHDPDLLRQSERPPQREDEALTPEALADIQGRNPEAYDFFTGWLTAHEGHQVHLRWWLPTKPSAPLWSVHLVCQTCRRHSAEVTIGRY
jgi:hypothetical protein